ncbi:MAG TPA: hypothetical protein VGF23_10130 [Gaiellaceae bacterium]
MKLTLVLVAASLIFPVSGPARPSSTTGVAACALLRLPRAAPSGEITYFGHIAALKRKGTRFELRFDPALWLTGITASRASLADTGSGDVPNDYFIRDLDHRLLTFVVPRTTRVTVLTRGTCTTRSSVAALARSPTRAGFWIRVRNDTVRTLDQQYQP